MSTLTCLFFLALLPNYAASITFNFTNISPQDSQDILFSGDADYTPDEGIRVTHERDDLNSSWLGGRATYIRPLHLWDNSTYLASFSTIFTLMISSIPRAYGDGLAFFLSENNSRITNGAALGLPVDFNTNTKIHPFVAVEFDTFGNNYCDPKDPVTNKHIGDHVGINVNTITSAAYKKWYSNITAGKECRVVISYNAGSKNLSVSFTNYINNSPVWETGLHYIVDLRKELPEWVIFGFSASTGDLYEKNNLRSWAFNSTQSKDEINGLVPTVIPKTSGQGNNNTAATTSPNVGKGKNSNMLLKVVLIVGAVVVVVVVLAMLAFFLWRRKKNEGDKVVEPGSALEMNNEFEMGAGIPRRFSYIELAQATANFTEKEKLGEGGFGGVYKGFLKDLGTYVAVKRVSNTSNQGIKEYASEVRIISRLRHKNLVQLTGWCHENGELLLVYEFMENGSLDLHLFKGKSLLTWNTRYKIALGVASALLYLHEEWEQCVLHRDIKSSNVMLDSNFNPKLGDFGLAKLVDHDNGYETTMVAGTIGYMAPEYIATGKASKESDVFSFGVVALEIACGRKPINVHAEERETKLVDWVWDLYGTGTLLEASDPSLGSNFTESEMRCLMIVGLWCAHPDSKLRPTIKQAIQVLNSEASLPILPSNMPYVTSSALPHFSGYGRTLSSDSEPSTSLIVAS